MKYLPQRSPRTSIWARSGLNHSPMSFPILAADRTESWLHPRTFSSFRSAGVTRPAGGSRRSGAMRPDGDGSICSSISGVILQFDSEDYDAEYRYAGVSVSGMPLAHHFDGLAVSFCSHEEWDTPSVRFEKTWATELDVETCTLDVLHASRASHLDSHVDWLKRWTGAPANGKELWARRTELFPSLEFCESVEEQICRLAEAMLDLR